MNPEAPGTPAPAAPEAPAAPAAPAAPVAPVTPAPDAPATPATPPAPVTPAPQKTADEIEADEWAEAENELFPGIKGKPKEAPKNEPAKPEKTAEEIAAEEARADETPEQKAAREADEAAENAKKTGEDTPGPEQAARDARNAARESAEYQKSVVADVRTRLYPDLPKTLVDKDGDPIETIEDVMNLINPRTNETFTEEEAGMFLLSAQQQFNQKMAAIDKQIEEVAETNLTIKEEADYINSKYGELLKANPELQQRLWKQYEKTLVKDEASGIITKAPVSLEEFYETALEPHANAAATAAVTPPAPDPAAEAAAAAQAKKEADAKRQRERADRSDIYAPNNNSTQLNEDDKEWAEAEQAVFGDQLSKK